MRRMGRSAIGTVPLRRARSSTSTGCAHALPRRGRRRAGRDGPRQPDLVVLLPRPRPRPARPTTASSSPTTSAAASPTSPAIDRYDYTLKRRVDDLEALLDHLGLRENLTLVLHDWGGMIGMAYAARHPERVKRLVVLEHGGVSACRRRSRFPWSLWLCRNTPLGPLLVRGLNAFCRGAAALVHASGRCRRQSAPATSPPTTRWANRIAVLRFVQDIPLRPGDPGYDLVQRRRRTGWTRFRGVPMLICWGERDFVFDRHFLAEWRRHFPQAEVHRFPDAGHYVLEDAGDEIMPAGARVPGDTPIRCADVPCSRTAVRQHRRRTCPRMAGDAAAHAGRRRAARATIRCGRVALPAPHLPRARRRERPPRPRAGADRHRPRHAHRADGAAGPRLLRPDVRPVQGRRGAGADRPRHGRARTSAAAWPRPSRRRSSACRRRTLARVAARLGPSRRSAPRHRRAGASVWGGVTLRAGAAGWAGRRARTRCADTRPDETAAILFTSGSTGVAKGVVYTHGIFAAQVEMLRADLRHRAGRDRPADVPAVRPVRPGPGHDGRRPGDGRDAARPRSTRARSSTRSRTSA